MTSTYRLAALTLFGVLFVLPVLQIFSGRLIAGAAAGRPIAWAPVGAASSHRAKIAVYENGLMPADGSAKVEYVSDSCPKAVA